MDELQKYPDLLNELLKQPGLVEEVIQLKINFKSKYSINTKIFEKITRKDFRLFSGIELLSYIKNGFLVTYSNVILYAQDKVALQLMQYFGARIDFKKDLNDFDIYTMSVFMMEEYWEEIKNIILFPKRGNNSIYSCVNLEVFELLHRKGIQVTEIVYPETQYKFREDLYTYNFVCWYWSYSNLEVGKKDVFKFGGYKIDLDLVNFVVYQFDDFKKEVAFNWKGMVFIMPKWYLYFWEFFGSIKSGEYIVNYNKGVIMDTYKWAEKSIKFIDKFFLIFNDLEINHLSSTGVNLFFILLDSQITNKLRGIELLLEYRLDPLKKDSNGISFFDVLLADEAKYSKAIELIKSKVSLNSFVRTPVFLNESKKTRVYPLSQGQTETKDIENTNLKENINVKESNELVVTNIDIKPESSTQTNQFEDRTVSREINKRVKVKQLTSNQRYSLSIIRGYFKEDIMLKCFEIFQSKEVKDNLSIINGRERNIIYFLLIISKSSDRNELFITYKEISNKLSKLKNEFENEGLINEMISFFERLYIIIGKGSDSTIIKEEKLFVINLFEYNRNTIFSTYLSYAFIDMESIMSTIKIAKDTSFDDDTKFNHYWLRVYECTADITSYLIKSILSSFELDLEDNYKHRIIAEQIKLEGRL